MSAWPRLGTLGASSLRCTRRSDTRVLSSLKRNTGQLKGITPVHPTGCTPLRPADVTRRNGTLLYEVNNRGNIAIFRQLHEARSNNDPATAADAGNGFLFRHGFTLVWSAWASDVAVTPGDNRLVLRPPPTATKDGTPITGKVAYELTVDAPRPTARFTGMLGTAYPLASEGARSRVQRGHSWRREAALQAAAGLQE